MRLDIRLSVSPKDVINVQYKYKRVVGRCRDCMMLNHSGQACPRTLETATDPSGQIRVVMAIAAPSDHV